MGLCFEQSKASTSSEEEEVSEEEDGVESPVDDDKMEVVSDDVVELLQTFLVCESYQILKMIEEVNQTSKCGTSRCNGK